MAKKPAYDPIVDRSLAPHFFVFSGLMFLTLGWTLLDEFATRRPWKDYQTRYHELAAGLLDYQIQRANTEMAALVEDPIYAAAAERRRVAAERSAEGASREQEILSRIADIEGRLRTIRLEFQDRRGLVTWAVYKLEKTNDPQFRAILDERVPVTSLSPEDLRRHLRDALGLSFHEQAVTRDGVETPPTIAADGTIRLEDAVAGLNRAMEVLQAEREQLNVEVGTLTVRDAEADEIIGRLHHRADLIEGLRGGLDTEPIEIRQRFNLELGFVDRCHSCHAGIEMPEEIAGEAAWRAYFTTSPEGQQYAAAHDPAEIEDLIHVFQAHPGRHLDRHPIEDFGCTSCHHGEGRATMDATYAHSFDRSQADPGISVATGFAWDDVYNHPRGWWTAPMFPPPFDEAGCVRCHIQNRHVQLPGGERVSRGRQLIEDLGCYGCHTIRSFGGSQDALLAARKADRDSRAVVEAFYGRDVVQPDGTTVHERGLRDVISMESLEDLGNQFGEPRLEPVLAEIQARGLIPPLEALMPTLRARIEGLPTGWDILDPAADIRRELSILVENAETDSSRRLQQAEAEYQPVAPELQRIREKVDPAWLAVWLAGPRRWRPTTWMPDPMLHRYDNALANQPVGAPDPAIIGTVMAYLWFQANAPRPDLPTFAPGDATRGAALFIEKGCVGCHMSEEVPADQISPRVRTGRRFGPNLARIGEKVSEAWLVRWLLDPYSYAQYSRMPRPRLTELEARDIAHYLTTLRAPDAAERAPAFAADLARDVERFVVDLPAAEQARVAAIADPVLRGQALTAARLSALEARDQTLAARVRQGRLLVEQFGCFNCHAINGFDPAQRIGTELSMHGSKELEMLDFGLIEGASIQIRDVGDRPDEGVIFLDLPTGERVTSFWPSTEHAETPEVPDRLPEEGARISLPNNTVDPHGTWWVLGRTRFAHYYTKIRWPRIFDMGRYRPGVHVPAGQVPTFGDALRMPFFGFSNDEALSIVTYILGLVDEEVPARYQYTPDAHTAAILRGEQIVRQFNCRGCHPVAYPPEQAVTVRGAVVNQEIRETLLSHFRETRHTALAPDGAGEGLPVDDPTARYYLPPTLDGEGMRVQPDWLYRFLRNPTVTGPSSTGPAGRMRPNLQIRMPDFALSERQATDLVAYFANRERATYPYEVAQRPPLGDPAHGITDAMLMDGARAIVLGRPGTLPGQPGGSVCLNCHYIYGRPPPGGPNTVPGPDIGIFIEKLRYDWVLRWLTSPPALVPGTAMPENWVVNAALGGPETRQPIPGVLEEVPEGERAAYQIEAVREFLFRLGEQGPSAVGP